MSSSWVSMVIAFGLILGFYSTRKLHSFKEHRNQRSSASTPIISQKLERKKKKASQQPNLKRTASLLLHPHSLEQAKLQYLTSASSFQGLYEPLYQASQGKLHKSAQTDLLMAWEHKIKEAHSQHLELVWSSSIHSPVPVKSPGSENVFRTWLKYLKGWGLQRSVEAGRICWSLNGDILEQCSQESEKSI